MINIPLNMVQKTYNAFNMKYMTAEELLEKFKDCKLDIESLRNVSIVSPHTNCIPKFKKRHE